MNDFINLSCQHCGAALQVDKDLTRTKCPYCGQESIVKMGEGTLLESRSRCPVCHRNDRTKKVSSIMTSTGENRAYFAIPPKPSRPANAIPAPPPQHPVEDMIKSIKPQLRTLLIVGVLAIGSLFCALSDPSNNSFAFLFFIAFGVAAFFMYRRYQSEKQNTAHSQNDYQNKLNDYQAQVNEYQQALQKQQSYQDGLYQSWLVNWEAAVAKWNKLYYCDRDDCVFVPGSESSAPLKEIEKFCYQKD